MLLSRRKRALYPTEIGGSSARKLLVGEGGATGGRPHSASRPLYFSFFFTHAYIGRLETHFFISPCVNYNHLGPIASRSAAALGIHHMRSASDVIHARSCFFCAFLFSFFFFNFNYFAHFVTTVASLPLSVSRYSEKYRKSQKESRRDTF